MKRIYYTLFLILFFTSITAAQTNTWVGGDDDWANDNNWSLGHVPESLEDVVINSGVANITDGFTADVFTVSVGPNGAIIIKGGNTLVIAKAGSPNHRLSNQGFISNDGTINIDNIASGQSGIFNQNNFANNGNINIQDFNGSAGHAILNANGGDFDNLSSGLITINNPSGTTAGAAIQNTGNGTSFSNQGECEITDVRMGILNTQIASIMNAGIFTIDNASNSAAVRNQSAALFNNQNGGELSLLNLNSSGGIDGIYNSASFVNNGYIETQNTSADGVDNRTTSGYFENNGQLVISGTGSPNSFVNSSLATLAGSGSITLDKRIFQNYILDPGNSPGVMEINGDLTHLASSLDTFEINGIGGGGAANGHDSVYVQGNLVLAGKLIIKHDPNFNPNFADEFILFEYDGSLSGSFSTIETSGDFDDFVIDTDTPGKIIFRNDNCDQNVNIYSGPVAGKWTSSSNWSLGHVPRICETVVINSGDSVVLLNQTSGILKMELLGGLFIAQNVELNIDAYESSDFGIKVEGNILNEGNIRIQNMVGILATGVNGLRLSSGGNCANNGTIEIENISISDGTGKFSSAMSSTLSSSRLENNGTIYIHDVGVTGLRNSGPVINNGTIEVENTTDGDGVWVQGEFTNEAGAQILINDLEGGGVNVSTGKMINEGLINVDMTDNRGVELGPFGELQNNQTINVSNTLLTNIILGQTSVLSGTGQLNFDQTTTTLGNFSPGNSAGILTFNGPILQHFSDAIDTFEIFGTGGEGVSNGHDAIHCSNQLNLNGKIVIELKDNFVPAQNDRFVLFKYADGLLGGSFNSVELPDAIADWILDTSTPGEVALQSEACTRVVNTYTGPAIGKWSEDINWSLGHAPRFCEEVVINAPDSVELSGGIDVFIFCLEITAGASLWIENGTSLNIDPALEQQTDGLDNEGIVKNQGEINVKNIESAKGIRNGSSGYIENAGLITIENYNAPNSNGLRQQQSAYFINQPTGIIRISQSDVLASASLSVASSAGFDNYGSIELSNTGALTTLTSGATFDNYGQISIDSTVSLASLTVINQGQFTNHPFSDIDITNSFLSSQFSNGIRVSSSTAKFINEGRIDIRNTVQYGFWCDDGHLINNGAIDVRTGPNQGAAGKDFFLDDGLYTGDGEMYGQTEILFDGILSPGASPGYIYFEGDVTLGAGNLDTFEIGGTGFNDYDKLEILDGDLMLDGLITIQLIDGFVPNDNDVFEIMTVNGGNISGDFLIKLFPIEMTGWEIDYSVPGRVRVIKPACTATTNNWIGTPNVTGQWTDGANWSLGHEPRYCEDVVIGTNEQVVIDDLVFAEAHSIDISGGLLHVNPIGFLNIDVDQDNQFGLRNRNGGEFTNFGDTHIFDTDGFNKDGVSNDASSTIHNGLGSKLIIFNIKGGLADGIANIGTMTNDGEIVIDNVVNSNGLQTSLSGSSFENNGTIEIRNILNNGLQLLSNGIFTQTSIGDLLIEDCGNLPINMNVNSILTLGGNTQIK